MAEVEAFKTAVIRARDVMRGPGMTITGMDSMRHICLYVLSRYITRERAAALGLNEELAWENLMHLSHRVNGGVQKAYDIFGNLDSPICLIKDFDRLFGTQGFAFDIKNIFKHKEMLEIFDPIDIPSVTQHIDILGWVYEQHISTGSSSAGRDLGQYFTDRAICNYMVNLCAPQLKDGSIPETMCDPAMGTGGFLTSYIKYYKRQYPETPVDWSIHANELHGCDPDLKVAGIARMNVFMETGGHRSLNIQTRDSLYGGLPRDSGYDIILANMPFGLKNLVHAECCDKVKDLKIRGTKSEPLFLQLMMQYLAPGGRCAAIVPDGMLSNNSKLHNGTRRYMIENFDLLRVVKMSGQFFMNTGIQPSILYFANDEFETDDIEFYEINKNTDGTISERLVTTVNRYDLDSSFSLDMRQYMPVEDADVHLNLFPIMNLKDICYLAIGGTPRRDHPEYYNGQNIWVSVGEINGETITNSAEKITDLGVRHSSVKLVKAGSILMSFKLSIGKCAIAGVDLYTNEAIVSINAKDRTQIINKYLFYFLSLTNFTHSGKGSISAGSMNMTSLGEIQISIPPREVQETIIASIERIFTDWKNDSSDMIKLTSHAMDLLLRNPDGSTIEPIVNSLRIIRGATAMIAQLRAQINDITMASLSREHNTTHKVQDLAMCNPRSVKEKRFDVIQYLELGSVKKGDILNYQTIPFDERPTSASKYVDVNDIIWGKCRPLSRSHAFIEVVPENLIVSSAFIIIKTARTDLILPEYLYYAITTDHCVNYLSNCSKGLYPGMHADDVLNYTINIPPIEIQQEVLTHIHLLRAQIKSLTQMQEQSENIARFILASHLAAPVIAEPAAISSQELDEVYPEENHGDGAGSSGTSHDAEADEADESDDGKDIE